MQEKQWDLKKLGVLWEIEIPHVSISQSNPFPWGWTLLTTLPPQTWEAGQDELVLQQPLL